MRWIAIAFLCGCGAQPEVLRYAGALEGTDARAAAVIEDDRILLYVCGGTTTLERTRWYEAMIEDFELGDRLTGELDGDAIDLALLDDPNAGLYHSKEGACRTGVIAGSTTIQGVSCDAEGNLEQVSPDAPIDRAGFMVQVGSSSLFVTPAHPE